MPSIIGFVICVVWMGYFEKAQRAQQTFNALMSTYAFGTHDSCLNEFRLNPDGTVTRLRSRGKTTCLFQKRDPQLLKL